MQGASQVESEHSSFALVSAISPDIPPGLDSFVPTCHPWCWAASFSPQSKVGHRPEAVPLAAPPTPQTPEARAQVNMTALSLHLTGTPSVSELTRKRTQ